MIILDEDLFFLKIVLIISETFTLLTTSDKDGLRIGLNRTPEYLSGR